MPACFTGHKKCRLMEQPNAERQFRGVVVAQSRTGGSATSAVPIVLAVYFSLVPQRIKRTSAGSPTYQQTQKPVHSSDHPLCSEAINCMLKSPLSFTSSQGLVARSQLVARSTTNSTRHRGGCASSWNQPTSPHVKTDAREMLDDHDCAPQVTTPLVV